MSQLIVKCIICSPLSIFHCTNKSGVCNDNSHQHQCPCPEWPPPQKKKGTVQSSSQSSSWAPGPSYKELRNSYDHLLKEHEGIGLSFQNQQKWQEDMEKESKKDMEELASLVRTKSEAIKTLQNKLAQPKKKNCRAESESANIAQQQWVTAAATTTTSCRTPNLVLLDWQPFSDHTRCDQKVVPDLKTVHVPSCSKQQWKASDNLLMYGKRSFDED